MLRRYLAATLLLACAWLLAGCATPAGQRAVSNDSLPPARASQPGDRSILAGEWEYTDGEIGGAVGRLTLDQEGQGHYDWKDGRFETHLLKGHTWHGRWFQRENDRDGGFTVKFLPGFSEGQGRWWYRRIGRDHAPMQKGGTFHLSRKTR